METTPNTWCLWDVSPSYLRQALNILTEHGVKPETIKVTTSLENEAYYKIIYYNPPINVPQDEFDSSEGATLQ